MTETQRDPGDPNAAGHHPEAPEQFDQEIDLKAVIWTGIGVAGMTIVSAVLMMFLMQFFSHADAKKAAAAPPAMPAVPAIPAMQAPARSPLGPVPSLQKSARDDMDAMRESEDQVMHHAAWVDRQQGTVRLPIDVAIEIVAAKGLPPTLATGASTSIDRGPTNQVSPGTVLPGPGQGVGQLGPSAAAPMSQSGMTPGATDVPGAARPSMLATPASPQAQPGAALPAPPAAGHAVPKSGPASHAVPKSGPASHVVPKSGPSSPTPAAPGTPPPAPPPPGVP